MQIAIVQTPYSIMEDIEDQHILLSFCTFCTLLKGKKLSYQNIFILLLQDINLRNFLRDMLGVNNDIEAIRQFIKLDSMLTKSKYIARYLNTQ